MKEIIYNNKRFKPVSFIHLWPILRKQNNLTQESAYLFDYLGTI